MDDVNALALLHVTFPDGSEQSVPIPGSPFNVGRAPENDLQLPHQLVSRHHARLLFQGEEMVLIDLNSSNGTLVGETRLAPSDPYRLSFDEPFSIGPYLLHLEAAPAKVEVRAEEQPAEGAPAVEAAPPEPAPRARPRRTAGPAKPPAPPEPPPPETGPEPPPYDRAFGLPLDRSRYLEYLPPIYREDPFLGRFLLAFEGVLAPVEQVVGNFDLYLGPRTAPAFFLDHLAAWLGLTLDEKWPVEKRRAVMAEAAELYRRRGTRWGLARHLQLYLDVEPEILEPEDRPYHFEVTLRVPAGQSVDRTAVERIIEANKPAHTTYGLTIVPVK